MTDPSGRRVLPIAGLVVMGAAAVLFTALAVSWSAAHSGPWALPLLSQLVTAVLVWLLLRNRVGRAGSAMSPDARRRFIWNAAVIAVGGLALLALAVFLVTL